MRRELRVRLRRVLRVLLRRVVLKRVLLRGVVLRRVLLRRVLLGRVVLRRVLLRGVVLRRVLRRVRPVLRIVLREVLVLGLLRLRIALRGRALLSNLEDLRHLRGAVGRRRLLEARVLAGRKRERLGEVGSVLLHFGVLGFFELFDYSRTAYIGVSKMRIRKFVRYRPILRFDWLVVANRKRDMNLIQIARYKRRAINQFKLRHERAKRIHKPPPDYPEVPKIPSRTRRLAGQPQAPEEKYARDPQAAAEDAVGAQQTDG
jgi:hypothetical protein